jgi:hypothetical protein
MRKFSRLNKLTNLSEDFVGVEGTLKTFSDNTIANKISGKKYHRFTADIETPSGKVTIGGQVYEALIPHLGATPQVGDKLNFAARIADLQDKQNAYWAISGNAVDAVSDDFLDAIASL